MGFVEHNGFFAGTDVLTAPVAMRKLSSVMHARAPAQVCDMVSSRVELWTEPSVPEVHVPLLV
jgi:hypothetical protein